MDSLEPFPSKVGQFICFFWHLPKKFPLTEPGASFYHNVVTEADTKHHFEHNDHLLRWNVFELTMKDQYVFFI